MADEAIVEQSNVSEPVVETISDDPWEAAQDEFEGEVTEPVTEEVKVETTPEAVKDAVKEMTGFDLDKLPIPRKYKKAVEDYIKPLIESDQKAKTYEKDLGQYKESSAGMLNVFKEIINDPSRLAQYVTQYGGQLGISPEVVAAYANANQPKPEPKQESQRGTLDQVFSKYEEQLTTIQDPKQFVGTLKQMFAESLNLSKEEIADQVRNAFGGYHEKYVGPVLEERERGRAEGERTANVSSWESAKNSVAGKYEDFSKYEPQVRDLLKNDPEFSMLRTAINQGGEKSGLARDRLIEKAYQQVSMADRIKQAQAPRPRFAGVEPNGKHVTTRKANADGWDDVKNDPDLGWT